MTITQSPDVPSPPYQRAVDDWEEWEDDDIVTPIDAGEQVLIAAPPPAPLPSSRNTKASSSRISRYPTSKLKRLKSRQRQQAQNAKAGIKLITDMTTFRPNGHIAHQLRTPDGRPAKFVDAAALKALEGEPNSASVGNWNWLRRNKSHSPASASPQSARTPDQGISPEDRPILIGISLPSEEMASRDISPRTATLDTPQASADASSFSSALSRHGSSPLARNQPVSVWSPDTPDTASSFNSSRPASSVHSHGTTLPASREDVPPVPALPTTYKKTHHQRLISLEVGPEDDDGGTPCTLFEEDGIPSPLRPAKSKSSAVTPDSAGSMSRGWWDHVVTPFTDKRLTFTSRKQKLESPKEESNGDLWSGTGAKESRSQTRPTKPSPIIVQTPIVRAPTPRRTPSPRTNTSDISSSRSSPALYSTMIQEKPQIIVTDDVPSEQPPPYSPPKKQAQPEGPIRYRAVFPPGHPLQAQFPPSPGPASPGLAATMTSQGATQLSDIPLTPTVGSNLPPAHAPLPIRPVGTSLPQEHAHEARGRVERERRRHEKEEAVARRLGGFWRGRGCIPKNGCFGRTGREGRKRRRVWMGVVSAILVIILIVVLSVVLTRPHHSPDPPSIWVNLTDFPPMPTGVLTVVGPDNTIANSGCTTPATSWSCSLPKEDQDSVAPYQPDQPTIIMQIQWDNSTKDSWKVPNGDAPPAPPAASIQARGSPASYASSVVQSRGSSDGFTPNPSAPDFEEMWFLGDTTDNITASQKAGEPTPFYISVLKSVNDTVDDPNLNRRDGTNAKKDPTPTPPEPDLESDGTPKPAVMLPQPAQQPVRLFDRGLPTEHYGFYTYFKRTIFLKSVTDDNVPLDKDGGCTKTEADFLTTWGQTRMLVQIWTRTLESNTSKLLSPDSGDSLDRRGSPDKSVSLVRPGTMPYPVTVTLDTHGGNRTEKFVWWVPMDDRQQVDAEGFKFLPNDIGVGSPGVVNPRGNDDDKFGGFDGGTGGCKCEWVNWV